MERRSEVYSWRVSPALKASLEEAAVRAGKRSVAELLEQIVSKHVAASGEASGADAATQRRLQARAARFAGCIGGRDASRASRVSATVRERLERLRRAR
jgi:hypothetical protein